MERVFMVNQSLLCKFRVEARLEDGFAMEYT